MRIDTKYSIGDTVQLITGEIGPVTTLELVVTSTGTIARYTIKVSETWSPTRLEADIKSKVRVLPLA